MTSRFGSFNLQSMDMSKLALFPMWFLPFLFSLCFHEYAHGWVARRKGDRTAEMMGRLTLNPISHMDMIGTLIMPLMAFMTGLSIFFGWAKPVPVNERNLKNPRVDMFWIAAAGPLSNLLLAAVASVLGYIFFIHLQVPGTEKYASVLTNFVAINVFLAVFNAIPIHPLDGGKIIARFLPAEINNKLEQNEQTLGIILLVLIVTGAVSHILLPPASFLIQSLLFWM